MNRKKLVPDDFKLPLVEEAFRLVHSAVGQSATHHLDRRTVMFVIRMEAWRELRASADFMTYANFNPESGGRNELLNIPVRLTVDDEPDTPMIQLVMEPMLRPRKTSK